MRISDWSSDVCSSDLVFGPQRIGTQRNRRRIVDREGAQWHQGAGSIGRGGDIQRVDLPWCRCPETGVGGGAQGQLRGDFITQRNLPVDLPGEVRRITDTKRRHATSRGAEKRREGEEG